VEEDKLQLGKKKKKQNVDNTQKAGKKGRK
jgi:hypothetical protein